jgi:hypothetical protein
MLCQRRCQVRQAQRRQQAEEMTSEIIRVSLRNLNLLGYGEDSSNHHLPPSLGVNPIRGMSLDDRRDFIKNILVSRVRTYCVLSVL